MATMKISLPDSLEAFVDEQVAARGYANPGDYVCALIREDHDRLHMRGLLLRGAESAQAAPADAAYFAGLRARARRAAG